jgi:hypothetical protein
MVSQQCKVEFKIGGYKMKFYVMLYLWMFVMFCWEDCGNMTGMSYMMEEIILIPWRRMGVSICCFQ